MGYIDQDASSSTYTNLKHYVYVYLDPTKPGNFNYLENNFNFEPFYIGVGSGNRDTAHLRKSNLQNDPNKHKTNKLKKLLNNNSRPIIKRIYINLSFVDALTIEKNLIKHIGRNDLGYGPLVNLTNGGEGTTGPKTEEHKQKLSKSHIGKKVVLSKESLIKRANSRKQNHKGYDLQMREKASKTRIERGVAKGNKNPAFTHDINIDEVVKLYKNGHSYRKIAKQFNTTHATISQKINSYNGNLQCI